MGLVDVKTAIKEADEVLREEASVRERKDAVRKLLRLAVQAGDVTDEQREWIEAAFPAHVRKSAEERVAKLREDLASAEAKLAA